MISREQRARCPARISTIRNILQPPVRISMEVDVIHNNNNARRIRFGYSATRKVA